MKLASFENADERLVPGQFARARVLLRTLDEAVLVPSRSIQINQTGLFVWVVGDDKTAVLRAVTTGPEVEDLTVLTSGVEAGETVVTDGQLRLFKGAKVAPKGDGKSGPTVAQETRS